MSLAASEWDRAQASKRDSERGRERERQSAIGLSFEFTLHTRKFAELKTRLTAWLASWLTDDAVGGLARKRETGRVRERGGGTENYWSAHTTRSAFIYFVWADMGESAPPPNYCWPEWASPLHAWMVAQNMPSSSSKGN